MTEATAARRSGGKLFRKYVLLFVALVGGTLLANGALELWFSYQENKAALARIQHEKALAAAARIEQFIDEITRQIGWTTRAQWSRSVLEQRRFEYLQLLRQAPAVTEVSHLDAQGREELRVSRLAMDVIGSGTDFSADPKFVEAKARRTWFSPVYFRKESEPYITVAIAGTGRDTGVTVAEVNLKFIWDVISRIKVGQAGYAYVVDTRGLLIAHPDIGLVLRKTDLSALPQVAEALAEPDGGSADGQALVGADSGGRQVLTAHAQIAPLDWTVFVDLPLAEAFAPLYASLQRTAALMLLGLALAVGAGIMLARRMVVPIQALQSGAARIGAGDLDHRIQVKTGDEVEALADQFNSMTAQLAESYAGLERKVEERTAELTESLEQQTATAEVLKVISRSRTDLQPVLDTLVETAARLCRADKTFLFRLSGDRYILQASHGASPEFIDFIEKNPIPPNAEGTIIGRTAIERRPVHYEDIVNDPRYTWKKSLQIGRMRTVLGVPLLRDGEPIGVIAAWREVVSPFSPKQIELITTFADQAVIAIENARLLDALQARTDELGRSLEELTATSDVLRIIAGSPGDLQPVLDTLVETAKRVCGADRAMLFRADGAVYRLSASSTGWRSQEFRQFFDTNPITPGRGTGAGRTIVECRPVQILDVCSDPEYQLTDFATKENLHTLLGVPLLREGVPIGVITVNRNQVKAFTQREIELLTTFADQAVIAIENARLLDALQARTDELGRSVEELTATSDVLRIIAGSPGDLQPVLNTLVETAKRVCAGDRAFLFRMDGSVFRMAAYSSGWRQQAFLHFLSTTAFVPTLGTAAGRTLLERRTIHIMDALAEPGYEWSEYAKEENLRTIISVPLMREGVPIGVITVNRAKVQAFTEREIELLTTFADQAVIAIENARLLDALQARTDELGRSVEELTTTSEVLRVIASSPGKLEPVLQSVAENAARLCEADDVAIHRIERNELQFAAHHGPLMRWLVEDRVRLPLTREWVSGRAVIDRQTIHVPDILADRLEYPESPALDPGRHLLGSVRTVLAVPLLREGIAIGSIVALRSEARPFTEKQIELVTSFADQAVIAIENARLLHELQARTDELAQSVDELKALGEVGRAVSSTLDLKTVLETIVARGAELGEAEACSIFRYRPKNRQFKLWHAAGLEPEFAMTVRAIDVNEDETVMGRAVRSHEPIEIPDLSALPNMPLRDASLAAGYRSVLIVPLVRADRVFGALVLNRRRPGEFSASTVNLLRTFASQSILAIQNARLFQEIEEKGQQLAIASQHKSQFLANMSHELRTPLNAILGYTELLLDGLYGKLGDKAQGVLERVQSNGKHLLGLINDVLDLAKIEAGQLTLMIADYSVGAIVQSVVAATESLAKAKGLELRAEIAPAMPLGRGDERRLTQVLLNLVGNAIKFTETGSVTVTARLREGMFRLDVRDTGPGIAEADQGRIFEEFQQVDNSSTRKKGGSGLGLAISRRIVELHGGTIAVESQLGAGATFRIELPVQVEGAREVA
jgi:GAF domain-containing protein/HAMP domain-containing protein/anti-sigma regulatory factor (Ser/Thr protein kinase)